MLIEVRLPQLADAMTAAKVGAWLKREGDRVVAGEPIVEVETDKTNVEIESPGSGILQKILIAAGSEGVMVDALLATIADAGEVEAAKPPAAEPVRQPVPGPAPVMAAAAVAPDLSEMAVPYVPAAVAEAIADAPLPARSSADVNVTPVARKMARLAGVDLAAIRPADGIRITKADVELALGKRESSPAAAVPAGAAPAVPVPAAIPAPAPIAIPVPAAAPASTAVSASPFEDRPQSPMRRVTATRLQLAKQTVPHFYLEAECRVDALLDLRAQWNRRDAGKLTVTDLLVFAASRALRKVPLANSSWIDSAVRVFEQADIAVAVNTPKGLIAPIVRGAGHKSLLGISRELAALADRARSGSLKPEEYTGGTFTISNLGMYAVSRITPIINTPQACILGVGAAESRPVISGTGIVAGRTMSFTLAADHRAIDGATGAEFLTALRRLIEDPLSLTIEG